MAPNTEFSSELNQLEGNNAIANTVYLQQLEHCMAKAHGS